MTIEASIPLVKTKTTVPKRRKELVHRARLVDFIHENTDHKLILVSAAAGYGKTSLLIDFARDTDLPVCWYSLDEGDADLARFVHYLIATVLQRFPHLTKKSAFRGQRKPYLEPRSALAYLVNAIHDDIADHFILIVDDYNFVDSCDEINAAFTWLLDHQPENICIVLASRTLPKFPMLRLTSKREVAGLGSGDLRFTAQEIQELLARNYNMQMPFEDAERLAQESEGWITGILLTTHTLWKGLLKSILEAKGSGERIFAYLATEVFDNQPKELCEFLRSSAVLKTMDASVCDALLGIDDSAELLRLADERNLFITRIDSGGESPTYRYHHLFREFLLAQWPAEEQSRLASLHVRAGCLFEERGQFDEAVVQYLDAQSYKQAADATERVASEMFSSGNLGTLAAWIDRLPKQVSELHPGLQLLRGRIWEDRGNIVKAKEIYDNLYRRSVSSGDTTWIVKVLVRQATLLLFEGRFSQAVNKCREVFSLANETKIDPIPIAEAHRIHGQCQAHVEDLTVAEKELLKALRIYEKSGDLPNVANVHQSLGWVVRRAGRLNEGEEHYRRALSAWEEIGNLARVADLLNNLGVARYYQGDYGSALRYLETSLEKALAVDDMRTIPLVYLSIGDVHKDLESYTQSLEFYSKGLDAAHLSRQRFLEVYSLAAMAEVYAEDNHFLESNTMADRARKLSQADHADKYSRGLAELSCGIVHWRSKEFKRAVDHLRASQQALEQIGAFRELARAYLYLGNALHSSGEEGFKALQKSLDLSNLMGYDQFLIVDGRKMLPFLKHALQEGVGTQQLPSVIGRAAAFSSTTRAPEAVGVKKETTSLSTYAFGNGEVRTGEKRVARREWGGPLVKRLFFYFLENGYQTREKIGVVFWPEYSPAKLRSSFHAAMSRLRRVLPSQFIIYDPDENMYGVNTSHSYYYDVKEFKELLGKGREARDRAEVEIYYRRAALLYRDDYLSDCDSEWCTVRREELRREYLEVVQQLGRLAEGREDYHEAINFYLAALRQDPFNEAIHRGVIVAHLQLDQRTKAIKHYTTYADHLKAEMDLSPSKELVDLYQSMLSRDRRKIKAS